MTYGYDNAGNLTSITDSVNSGRSETYTVDDLNRLHTASGAYGSRTYTYDNNSGRSTKVVGTTTYTTTRVTSKNRIDHITDGTNTRHFTWTSNGELATDDRTFVGGGAISNTYGGRDRLESMTVNSQTVSFTVNAIGQRVSKTFSGTTTHFVHDIHGNMIAEADGSTGSTTKEYVWMEGMLLAQIDGSGNIVYVHSDQVNTPQKITDPGRTLVWDREQEPFGETYATPTSTIPTNLRFPGQYADAENSLSYNNARDYDPSTGFYIEADPLGLAGGLNPYAYTGQNPVHAIDPSGLWFLFVSGVVETPGPLRVGEEGILLGGHEADKGWFAGSIVARGGELGSETWYGGYFRGREYLMCSQAEPVFNEPVTLKEGSIGIELPLLPGVGVGAGRYSSVDGNGTFVYGQIRALGEGVFGGGGISDKEVGGVASWIATAITSL